MDKARRAAPGCFYRASVSAPRVGWIRGFIRKRVCGSRVCSAAAREAADWSSRSNKKAKRWLVPRSPARGLLQKTRTIKLLDLAVVARTRFWSFCAGRRRIGRDQATGGTYKQTPRSAAVVAKRQNGWATILVGPAMTLHVHHLWRPSTSENNFMSRNLAEPVADARLCCARAPARRHVAPRRPRSELFTARVWLWCN